MTDCIRRCSIHPVP